MSARKGWCPALATPMEAHDGLLVRVKPTAATMAAGAARALARAAGGSGNGLIDVTLRGNLQFRGLKVATAPAFAAVALAHGLGHRDPRVEAVRNVAADPLGRDDPHARGDSHALARALEDMLAATPALWSLPAKFGFLADGGGALPLASDHADIVLRATGGGRWSVTLADAPGLAADCADADAAGAAERLARAFLDIAGRRSRPVHRMRHIAAGAGAGGVFEAAGLVPQDTDAAAPAHAPGPGFLSLGGGRGVLLARAPRGRIASAQLAGLAELCDIHGDGTLRMTPWRAIALAGVAAGDADRLAARAAGLGFDCRAAVRPEDAA